MTYDHWKTTNPADEFLGDVLDDQEEEISMTQDIVERLRTDEYRTLNQYPQDMSWRHPLKELRHEAADEIERLRAELYELTEPISDAGHTTADGLRAEIEQLRSHMTRLTVDREALRGELEWLRQRRDASPCSKR